MAIEQIIAVLSCAVMTAYLATYINHNGVPKSISATYYRIVCRWMFPLTVATSGVMSYIPMLRVTPVGYEALPIVIVASIFMVSATPSFKERLTRRIHYGSAIVLGASSMAWLILVSGLPYISISAAMVAAIERKHYLFWIEVGLLFNMYVTLFCKLA